MDIYHIKHKEYHLLEELKNSNDDYFYAKCECKGNIYILRKYNTEFVGAIDEQKKLNKYGINIPKLIAVDKKQMITIEESIDGKTCFEELLDNDLDDKHFELLFVMYRFCRFSKINLDYNPKNFILKDKKLYYTGRHFWPLKKEKNLENEGIRYWLYTNEFANYLQELSINVDFKRVLPEEVANKKIVLLCVTYW